MTKELTFTTNAQFQSVTYDKDADSWYLVFASNIAFNVQTIWRLRRNKKIHMISLDHGQQFGLPAPIDLVVNMTSELKGKRLLKIQVKETTADLCLSLSDDLEIEIFISSSGYESYNFSIDKTTYIGMGSGNLAIFGNQ